MKHVGKADSAEAAPLALVSETPSFYLYAEANPNPVLITNIRGEIQFVNVAWERTTGYSSDEVRGKNPRFMGSGKTPPELYKALWEALTKGDPFESEEFIDRKKDGTEFSIRTVFFPIKIRGEITYLVQVLHDISKRKEIERQKDAFISSASHELRSPLSVIMLSLDLLKHKLDTVPEATISVFKTLQDETSRFTSLLNDLLDVGRIQSGQLRTHKEERDVGALFHQVINELQMIHPTHTLITEDWLGEPTKAICDAGQIAQVLVNLVSNAVKYSPQANRVLIRLERGATEVVVSVQDFGIGIAKEEQQKIFNMFYRAKNKGQAQGTGLGLYITMQIIATHNGRLWVTSKLGEGSTFSFSLPLA